MKEGEAGREVGGEKFERSNKEFYEISRMIMDRFHPDGFRWSDLNTILNGEAPIA